MKVLLIEKSNEELINEYHELMDLEKVVAWDQRQQADDWERIWLKALRARIGIVKMALEERGIYREEV